MKFQRNLVKSLLFVAVLISPLAQNHVALAVSSTPAPYKGDIREIRNNQKNEYINYYKSFGNQAAFMRYDTDTLLCNQNHIPEKTFTEVEYLDGEGKAQVEDAAVVDYIVDYDDNSNIQALARIQKETSAESVKHIKDLTLRSFEQEELPVGISDGEQFIPLIEKGATDTKLSMDELKVAIQPIKKKYQAKICFDNGGYTSMLYTIPKITGGMTPTITYKEGWMFATVKDGKLMTPSDIFTSIDEVNAYITGLALDVDCLRIVRNDVDLNGVYKQNANFTVRDSSVLMAQDGVYVKVISDNGHNTYNYISVRVPQELLKEDIQLAYKDDVESEELETPTLDNSALPELTQKPSAKLLEQFKEKGLETYTALGQPTKMYDFMGNGALSGKKSNFESNGIVSNYFLMIPSVLDQTGLKVVPDGSMNYLSSEDKDNKNYQAIEKLTKKVADEANEVILRLDEKLSAYDLILASEKKVGAQFVSGNSLKSEVVFTCKGDNTYTQEQIAEKVAKAREQYTPIISYDNHGYTSIVYSAPGSRNDYSIIYHYLWMFSTYKDGKVAPLKDVVADINTLHLYLIGLASQKGYVEDLYLLSDIGPDNTNWFITEEGVFLQIGPGVINTSQSAVTIRIPDALLTDEMKTQYADPVGETKNEDDQDTKEEQDSSKKPKSSKFQKFIKKNKIEVILASLLIIGLLIAIISNYKAKKNKNKK